MVCIGIELEFASPALRVLELAQDLCIQMEKSRRFSVHTSSLSCLSEVSKRVIKCVRFRTTRCARRFNVHSSE